MDLPPPARCFPHPPSAAQNPCRPRVRCCSGAAGGGHDGLVQDEALSAAALTSGTARSSSCRCASRAPCPWASAMGSPGPRTNAAPCPVHSQVVFRKTLPEHIAIRKATRCLCPRNLQHPSRGALPTSSVSSVGGCHATAEPRSAAAATQEYMAKYEAAVAAGRDPPPAPELPGSNRSKPFGLPLLSLQCPCACALKCPHALSDCCVTCSALCCSKWNAVPCLSSAAWAVVQLRPHSRVTAWFWHYLPFLQGGLHSDKVA